MKKNILLFGVLAAIITLTASAPVWMKSKGDNLSSISFTKLIRAFDLIPAARADGFGQLANAMRMLFFMIVGFPDDATYTELNPSGDGPPQAGMVGMVYEIAGQVAKAANVASCAALPTSGSVTPEKADDGLLLTATFATPDVTIPTGYEGAGGTYEKKFMVSTSDGTAIMTLNFDCSVTRGHVYFSFPEDDTTTRKINMVYQMVDNVPKADFAMYYNSSEDERFLFRLEGDSTTAGQYAIHMIRAAKSDDGDGYSAFRLHAKGNSTQEKATVFFQALEDEATMAAVAADAQASSTSLVTDLANMRFLICIDFTDPDSAALGECTGLALSAPSAPHFGASNKAWTAAYGAGITFVSGITDP